MSEVNVSAPSVEVSAPSDVSESAPNSAPIGSESSPKDAPEPKAEAPKFKKKIKVKEVERELDEDELAVWAQKGFASSQAFQEAAKLKKEAEAALAKYDDPMEYFKSMSAKDAAKVREAAEKFLFEKLQEEALTPEQKRLRELEEENKRYKETEKQKAEREAQEERSRIESKYTEDYDRKITEALNSANIPKNPAAIRRVAQHMLNALEAGVDLDPRDAIEYAKQDFMGEIKELLSALDENSLLSFMGDDIAGKIRKADLARVKASKVSSQNSAPQLKPESNEPKSEKKLTSEEFRAAVERDAAKMWAQLKK